MLIGKEILTTLIERTNILRCAELLEQDLSVMSKKRRMCCIEGRLVIHNAHYINK